MATLQDLIDMCGKSGVPPEKVGIDRALAKNVAERVKEMCFKQLMKKGKRDPLKINPQNQTR